MSTVFSRLRQFVAFNNISNNEFGRQIGCSSAQITQMLTHEKNFGIDKLLKVLNTYPQLSTDWLLNGKGTMLKKTSLTKKTAPEVVSNELRIVTVDNAGHTDMVAIPIVDISVAAGSGYHNEDYITADNIIHMPRNLIKGECLCVRIKGSSMEPSLFDGGYVIVKKLHREAWVHARNEHVYVISDTDGKSYLKRIKNQLKDGYLILKSDNPEFATSSVTLQEHELHSMWHAEWYFSDKMPNVQETFYKKIEILETRFDALEAGLSVTPGKDSEITNL